MEFNQFKYLNLSFLALDNSWQKFLLANCYDELIKLDNKLHELSQNNIVYPPRELVFNAMSYMPIKDVRVVILGQDPYHGENEANGLAFAVNKGIKLPPSLRNIFKELHLEFGVNTNDLGGEYLINWAKQGVLLLNSGLSVLKDQANSLVDLGWHNITDMIIKYISTVNKNVVFILWGNFAKAKTTLIDSVDHLVLTGAHPSPFSSYRGFFGCGHFKRANEYLSSNHYSKIDWVCSDLFST